VGRVPPTGDAGTAAPGGATFRRRPARRGVDFCGASCYDGPERSSVSAAEHRTREEKPGMTAYLRAVWACRYFWISLVRMDLRTRYRGSFFGMGWSLLSPVAMTAVLCTIVTTLFKQDPWSYATFLFAGLTFWYFVLGVTTQGCHCFRMGESYIRQFPVPMAIYPLRTVLGCATHYCLALTLVVAVTGWTRGVSPLALLGLVPALVLLLITGWSVAVLVGLLNVRFRDTAHMMDIALQVLFYSTPVLYPAEMLGPSRLGRLLAINPVMPFLRLLRDPIITGNLPTASVYASAVLVTGLFAAAAGTSLYYQERRLIFHL
jgi:ABC-type polysaccharide/polyol phosphate export permease